MTKKLRLFNLLCVFAFFVSACNMPSGADTTNAANTAAAKTLQALLSATPVVPPIQPPSATPVPLPATLTPIPQPIVTNTPLATATSNCNVAQFIKDVTIPDGTVVAQGQAFVKTWRIKNVGTCAWNGFSLVFDSGDAMGAPATSAVAVLNPGQEIDLSVNMTAPTTPGAYRSYWRIVTNSNILVPIVGGVGGKSFYADIKVQNGTVTPSTPATQAVVKTSTPNYFAVTSVSFTTSGDCTGAGWNVTANITGNREGTVTYHFVRSDGAIDGAAHAPLNYTAAGTQTSEPYAWSLIGTPGTTYWVEVYIDTPNNQQFGRASITCP